MPLMKKRSEPSLSVSMPIVSRTSACSYFQATTLFLTCVHQSCPSVEGLSSPSEYQLQEPVRVDHMRCQAGQQAVHYFDDRAF
jgi:hypothetical protein